MTTRHLRSLAVEEASAVGGPALRMAAAIANTTIGAMLIVPLGESFASKVRTGLTLAHESHFCFPGHFPPSAPLCPQMCLCIAWTNTIRKSPNLKGSKKGFEKGIMKSEWIPFLGAFCELYTEENWDGREMG